MILLLSILAIELPPDDVTGVKWLEMCQIMCISFPCFLLFSFLFFSFLLRFLLSFPIDLGLAYTCVLIALAGWLADIFLSSPAQASSRMYSFTTFNIVRGCPI